MSVQFNSYQQVFCLSWLSNIIGTVQGSTLLGVAKNLQNQFQKDLSYFMEVDGSKANILSSVPPLIGDWSLVWGPGIKVNVASSVSANGIYVAYSDNAVNNGPTYVVAVAATNGACPFDWTVEDLDVSTIVDFSTFSPNSTPSPVTNPDSSTPYISNGTAVGLGNLLNIVGGYGDAKTGTLSDFLSTIPSSQNATIVFTGHSLGGALSPTLALWLKVNNQLSQFSDALVYPTAGASPGETNFSDLFAQNFPADSNAGSTAFQWNRVIWNTYDVVPHAWGTSGTPSLAEVASLYVPAGGSTPAFMTKVQNNLISKSKASGVQYTPVQGYEVPNTLQTVTFNYGGKSITANYPPQVTSDYIYMALYQHIDAYVSLLGIGDFLDAVAGQTFPLVAGVEKTTWLQATSGLVALLLALGVGAETDLEFLTEN